MIYTGSSTIIRLNNFMIRLIHYIKERPLLLLGNHACPSLVTPSTMWNRNCYQDEMFITAETGGLWSMQKLRSAAVSFHICQDKKPNSFSLSTPLQFTLGPKYFLLFHMLFFFFFCLRSTVSFSNREYSSDFAAF